MALLFVAPYLRRPEWRTTCGWRGGEPRASIASPLLQLSEDPSSSRVPWTDAKRRSLVRPNKIVVSKIALMLYFIYPGASILYVSHPGEFFSQDLQHALVTISRQRCDNNFFEGFLESFPHSENLHRRTVVLGFVHVYIHRVSHL